MKKVKTVPPEVIAYHQSEEQLRLLVSKFLKYAAADTVFVRALATGGTAQHSITHALVEQGAWVEIHPQTGDHVRVTVSAPRSSRRSGQIWLHIPYAAMTGEAAFDHWMAKYCKEAEADHLARFVRDRLASDAHHRAFSRLSSHQQTVVMRQARRRASKSKNA